MSATILLRQPVSWLFHPPASVEENLPMNILFAPFGLVSYQRTNFHYNITRIFLLPKLVFKITLCTYIMAHISFFYRNFKHLSGAMEFMTINGTTLKNLEILQNQVR